MSATRQPTVAPSAIDRGRSAPSAIWLLRVLTLVLIGLSIVLLRMVPQPFESSVPSGALAFVLVVLGFLLVEHLVFSIEYRREGISFAASEIPLVFALVYLSPVAVVAARLIGANAALVFGRRRPLFKHVLNLATFTVEALLASVVYRSLLAEADPDYGSLWTWGALVVAVSVAMLCGGLVVALAVAIFDGGFRFHFDHHAVYGHAISVVTALFGAVAAAPSLVNGWLVSLTLLPFLALWVLVRSFGRLTQRHHDLVDVHDFTGLVGHSLQLDEIVAVAAERIGELLRTQRSAIVVFGAEGRIVQSAAGTAFENELPLRIAEELRSGDRPRALSVVATGRSARAEIRALGQQGIRELLVAPLLDRDELLGVLVLANREGVNDIFGDDERRRVATLSQQLVLHLRKALLHERIEDEATHDRLTGLPNRTSFERDIAELGADSTFAVMMIDLDRFKEVNDTLGHHVGDELLVEFARRAKRLLRGRDVLARFAGDEFAVLLVGADAAGAELVARRIVRELLQPFELHDLKIVVSCSIGVAIAPAHGSSATVLLRRADVAMYVAKRNHAGWELYRPEIDINTAERLALLSDLRAAIEDGELDVHFQPKLALDTSTVTGAEALVRWSHPQLGLVPPDRFVPLAEQTGLIHQLTMHVLDRSIDAVRHWRELGYRLGVSVNLSSHNLLDALLPDRIARLLAAHGVPWSALTLEITESSVMTDTARTMATIGRLRELGAAISVDDFGTGYSSLTYLRRLPVSEIKVDRSFVINLEPGSQDEVIVRSTVELGHNLGLQVVAEGAEDHVVIDRLRALGCDLVQGYGIARPLPRRQFEDWLVAGGYRILGAIEAAPPATALLAPSDLR